MKQTLVCSLTILFLSFLFFFLFHILQTKSLRYFGILPVSKEHVIYWSCYACYVVNLYSESMLLLIEGVVKWEKKKEKKKKTDFNGFISFPDLLPFRINC